MYFDYANVLVFLFAAAGFVFANMYLGALIRPKKPNAEKNTPYECGEDPIGDAWIRFDIRYYTVALIYIVFAVEVAFLFPWARILKNTLDPAFGISRNVAFFEGLIFVVILGLGLAYVWVKGDIDWVKTIEKPRMPEGQPAQAWKAGEKIALATGMPAVDGSNTVSVSAKAESAVAEKS